MRITIFGATGAVGSRVAHEALSRGHEVTAVGRNEQRLWALALRLSTAEVGGVHGAGTVGNAVVGVVGGLLVRRGDAADPSGVAGALRVRRGNAADPGEVARLSRGQDLVISATRPVAGEEGELAIAAKGLVSGLAGSGVRLLIVGGAASLTLPGDPGTTVVDGPGFPVELRPIALACNEQLEVVRGSSELDWAYLSPPALLEPGVRTGSYRVGQDELLIGADGSSYLSMEDFAIALVDEAERPRHHRVRFTVGS